MLPERLWYILNDDHEPVPCTIRQFTEFRKDFSLSQVANTQVGDCRVSTVFLGLDHRFGPAGPPVLFETMIFSKFTSPLDGFQERYTSWTASVAGHERAVQMARKGPTGDLEESEWNTTGCV